MELNGYFDYNATTPLCVEAKAAWSDAVEGAWLNPSSPYRAAANVHAQLEAAREAVASLVSVESKRVVFNSGATEGNNSVFAHWSSVLPSDAIVGVSPTEHPSVIEAAKYYFGERVCWLALDAAGAVDLAALAEELKVGNLQAVSVMAANNETGIFNPWVEIAAACRATGCAYHCDASQWVGKLPLAGLAACDYVTACAHKFGGPRGAGFLLLPASGANELCSLQGGVQESGHRAGTEDVPSILAMVAALTVTKAEPTAEARDRFIAGVLSGISGAKVVGVDTSRLWNTVSLIMPEFASERWIRALEKRGFLISAGSACSSGKAGPSHVLSAMQLDTNAMRRVLRISSGWKTQVSDWEALLAALLASYDALRSDAAGSNSKVISI
ncbi:MAG: cysteine desulfurase family protein [Opitutaceae bacterium]